MSIIVYFLKVSVALAIFWLMYSMVFRRLTFFTFNRLFLIGSVLLSFILPLVRFVDHPISLAIADYSLGINWEQIAYAPQEIESTAVEASSGLSLSILLWIYFIATGCFIIRGMIAFLAIRRKHSVDLVGKKAGITYVVGRELDVPFTVFRRIYLDPRTYQESITPVIRHEMVHARQLHSVDLLIMEFACAFLWFNPFVFLFKRSIRDNHEYLADDHASRNRNDLIPYMQALSDTLNRSVSPAYASYFTSSTIKKRIIMLTNRKTPRFKKFLYLLIIPVIALTVMSFQQPVEDVLGDPVSFNLESGGIIAAVDDPSIPSRFPLEEKFKKRVTLNYGWEGLNPVTKEKMVHKGIDFKAPQGTAVYATADGVVAKSMYHEGYGKLIILKHEKGYSSLYAHLDERKVEAGEKVKIGQKIGTVGTTGRSTGDHLHYEVRKDGENVDPSEYY